MSAAEVYVKAFVELQMMTAHACLTSDFNEFSLYLTKNPVDSSPLRFYFVNLDIFLLKTFLVIFGF
jgi:hypothetical protein